MTFRTAHSQTDSGVKLCGGCRGEERVSAGGGSKHPLSCVRMRCELFECVDGDDDDDGNGDGGGIALAAFCSFIQIKIYTFMQIVINIQ